MSAHAQDFQSKCKETMEEPERKFNLVSCLIISVIGSFFGALGITGLIVPFAQLRPQLAADHV